MQLIVEDIFPHDKANFVPIDSKIEITFNQPVDPFTVTKGISIYAITEGLWTGPDLALLDTQYKDVLDTSGEYTFFPFNWTSVGNKLILTPVLPLLPNKQFYVSVLPGDDANRFLSKSTFSTPSAGIEVTSSYLGLTDSVYDLVFSNITSASGTVDISKDSVYEDSVNFLTGTSFSVGDISISIDTIPASGSILVWKAEGADTITLTTFTTSEYAISNPTSTKITSIGNTSSEYYIIDTSPRDMSINNKVCNPVSIRFNKSIVSIAEDLVSSISILRTDIDTGLQKRLGFFYKVTNDVLKLYLDDVGNVFSQYSLGGIVHSPATNQTDAPIYTDTNTGTPYKLVVTGGELFLEEQ